MHRYKKKTLFGLWKRRTGLYDSYGVGKRGQYENWKKKKKEEKYRT
jgi:hypothetical protein